MIQKLKGTKDILPGEIEKWQYIESVFESIFNNYGYNEIRVPVIESTDLFIRGVGEVTDVVEKEMYIFEDKGGRSISLRPEGTAGVIRAYIENGMSSLPSPVKLFYEMSIYRYENIQKGRQREFNQIGAELIGSGSYTADIEMIKLISDVINALNIKDIELRLNSIGCLECRNNYKEALKKYIEPNIDNYCEDCRRRFEKNPMRILDCKVEADKKMNENAPRITDYLCEDCKEHFRKVQEGLDNLGISYTIDTGIVRGLDYYTKTVFEFISKVDDITVFGGGRYDGLVEELGGANVPAVGFATGVERLLDVFIKNNPDFNEEKTMKLFIANIGENAEKYVSKLVSELRNNDIYVENDLMGRSLNAQLKYADKKNAEFLLIIGDEEIKSNKASLKNMKTGDTKQIDLDNLINELK